MNENRPVSLVNQPPMEISSEKPYCVRRASTASQVGRLYSLDALRGIAALAVVVRHWPQHFGTLDASTSAYKLERMPFFNALAIGYKFGEMAVPFFFCLSGFVFFWLYAQPVRNREVSARNFLILRFSRLIPLHWLTLVAVCILQFVYSEVSGGSRFVFANFDAFHFFLNVFLCNGVGFEKGFSFNGPTWSVSVEVLCYFVFFVFAYYTNTRLWQVVLLLLGFWALVPVVGVTSSLIGFMCGGVAYLGFDCLSTRVTRWFVLPMWLGLLAIWMLAIYRPAGELLSQYIHIDNDSIRAVFVRLYTLASNRIYQLIVFPVTIAVFALTEFKLRLKLSFLSHLGDLSYAIYLLHFPLQVVFAIAFLFFHLEFAVFEYRIVFALYFLILIPLSYFVYHYFERPCQMTLRNFCVRKV